MIKLTLPKFYMIMSANKNFTCKIAIRTGNYLSLVNKLTLLLTIQKLTDPADVCQHYQKL